MASSTIHKLEETTKRKLKVRAAMHGRSKEQEARKILKSALKSTPPKSGANLAAAIHRRFARLALWISSLCPANSCAIRNG